MKIVILSLCTVIISSVTYLYHGFSHYPAICLIPENYCGDVYIIYDQPSGRNAEFDGNNRIYRIPDNGILFTKFKMENYTADQQYYYDTPEGKRKKLIQISTGDFNEPWSYHKNQMEPSRNKIAIIDGGIIWSTMSPGCSYEYQHSFVGTYNQFTSYKGFSFSYLDSLQKSLSLNTKEITR
jgi:hypothetical protein